MLLPKIYYKGYYITLNGKEIKYNEGKYGFIEINSKDIKSGNILIEYKVTKIQNITKIISIISILYLLIYWIYLLLKKNKNTSAQ